jgi:hypothetical protein
MVMMIGEGINNINIEFPKSVCDERKDIDSSTFKVYLIAIVKDPNGNIIQIHRQKSHSPTPNFIGLLLPLIWFNYNNISYTITNTGGNTYSYEPQLAVSVACISYPSTGTNCPTYLAMIQVGSGSQPNPSTATSLAAPISNGSGTGQLLYGAISIPSNITASGSSTYFYIAQTYNNQSGGTINITEVGVILNLYTSVSGACSTNAGQVLVWYDVLSSAISIPNGGSLTIYYTFMVNP